MILSCPERTRYFGQAGSLSGIEKLHDEALAQTRQTFSARHPVQEIKKELQLKRRTDGQIILTLPDYIKIWVIDKTSWAQAFGSLDQRGRHYPQENKILLQNRSWCKKTLIHETLHSLSIFNLQRNWDEFAKTKIFAEGLTEFVTGLFLYRKHIECYESWRLNKFPQWCNLSYPRETKTFYAFCGFVHVQRLLDFYFGIQETDLVHAWSKFIAAIRQETRSEFKDVYGKGIGIELFTAFRNECEKQFGKKFRKKLKELVDYGTLL